MNWLQLLSARRPGEPADKPSKESRSRFEQDYDRIIFSHPFRKLQDKTQVFPLPEDDFVHTRLTHSLEVSSVGRSLGKNAGAYLINRDSELKSAGITDADFGGIVGAACLAHDLGNPPFGHSGEDSLSSFFLSNSNADEYKKNISLEEWKDLTTFEGNAQGFRILNSDTYRGLKLTYATLGAFTKYPISSSAEKEKGRKSQKKFGFYQSDSILFKELAEEMGLIQLGDQKWCRHPLAFLVEAADDICYNIIDLEDGCRLGLVPFETVSQLLAEIIGDRFSQEKLNKLDSLNEKLGTLRALAIGQLIKECSDVFNDNEEKMLDGSFDKSLTGLIHSAGVMEQIIALSIEKIYRSKQVLEKEAGGYEVIESLIEAFATAAQQVHTNSSLPKHQSIFRLLPQSYTHQISRSKSTYQVMQLVIDFVSGLTDSHAVRLYQTIKGYRLSV